MNNLFKIRLVRIALCCARYNDIRNQKLKLYETSIKINLYFNYVGLIKLITNGVQNRTVGN